jgi:hypothetical protein
MPCYTAPVPAPVPVQHAAPQENFLRKSLPWLYYLHCTVAQCRCRYSNFFSFQLSGGGILGPLFLSQKVSREQTQIPYDK